MDLPVVAAFDLQQFKLAISIESEDQAHQMKEGKEAGPRDGSETRFRLWDIPEDKAQLGRFSIWPKRLSFDGAGVSSGSP